MNDLCCLSVGTTEVIVYALVCLSRAPVFGNVFYMLIVTCYKHVVGANILSIQQTLLSVDV